MEHTNRVAGVAHKSDIAKVTFVAVADQPGVAHLIFSGLAEAHINAELIVQNIGHDGRTDLSFTVAEGDLRIALEVAEAVRDEVGTSAVISKGGMATVSIVGAGLGSNLTYASTMFAALGDLGINIDMISTSGIRLTCVIDGQRVQEAVRALHRAFDLENEAA